MPDASKFFTTSSKRRPAGGDHAAALRGCSRGHFCRWEFLFDLAAAATGRRKEAVKDYEVVVLRPVFAQPIVLSQEGK
eukprot:CAMPEP_0172726442 /NCGR_PEP_ID=MMETSP1074-20121228/90704_1 /TAXON_ID=2916 /ORGANISM="Ceratium fusus, Strain PA161109" /LENGTH=77 /DNA_ID=CAMNT_0013553457 /DNA_START=301 /DNA_END=534 /DNA_ORIENTATION=-